MKPGGLNVEPHLARPDDFYQGLLDLHRNLSDEQSRLANAKLILLFANHIGDHAVLDEALRIAREGLAEAAASADGQPPPVVMDAIRAAMQSSSKEDS